MASVVLKDLEKSKEATVESGYTYVDLHLDIEKDRKADGPFIGATSTAKDIQADYDEQAIRNSLINIFNTIPGERFLLPTFGANLLGYVFEQMTEATARAIGNTIFGAIKRWEPRVTVVNVDVVGNPDENEYVVNVIVAIPILRKPQVRIVGILGQNGFREYNVSEQIK